MNKDNIKFFNNVDLENFQHLIFIDSLNNKSLLRNIKSFLKPDSIIIFNAVSNSVSKSKLFRALVKENMFRKFSWHPFSFAETYKSNDDAYDVIESFYVYMVKYNKIPFKQLKKLYDHRDIEMAFKKELITQLKKYFDNVNYIKYLINTGSSITYIPSLTWRQIDLWLQEAGLGGVLPDCFRERNKNLFIYPYNNLSDYINLAINKTKAIASLLCIVPWIITRIRSLKLYINPSDVHLAIRLYNTDFGFRGELTQSIDWPIDNIRITKDNTIFVGEMELSKSYESEIKKREYQYVKLSPKNTFRVVTISFLLKELFWNSFVVLPYLFVHCLRAPCYMVAVSTKALFDYYRWTSFLNFWRPKYHLSYNHVSATHIFRNILLEKADCKTWLYNHTNSNLQSFHFISDKKGKDIRWAYLKYDNELYWGVQQAKLAKKQCNKSRKHSIYGPIWAGQSELTKGLNNLITDDLVSSKGIVLAVFPATYRPNVINREIDHYCFLESLLDLLKNDDFPNLKVFFKEKSDYESYLGFGGTNIRAIHKDLKNESRVFFVDRNVSPMLLAQMADVSLSMAFTSTTIEALVDGRPSFYLDACSRYPSSYFEKFPKLVAHGPEQLPEYLSYWTNISDNEFQEYLDEYIYPEYGGRFDKTPMDRIREDLSR